MPPKAKPAPPLSVAITGANGSLGQLVLPRLCESAGVAKVLSFDLTEPAYHHPSLTFAQLDLTRPTSSEEIGAMLREHEVQAMVHLAFFSSRVVDPAYAHEVETIGTSHVLNACAAAGVESLVLSSSTMVYGASPKNPNYLEEERALPARVDARYVDDKLEAEAQVRRLVEAAPKLRATVLRFAPIIGPRSDTPFTRYLRLPAAPTVLGHDPLMQCLHEEDAAEAVLAALLARRAGIYNVAGRGVLPLSHALELAGTRALPLPHPLAAAGLRTMNALGLSAVPPAMLEYLKYLWVADTSRTERELQFKPGFSSREALIAFCQGRGEMRRSA